MPLLGAHMSIAGGVHLAIDRIRQVRGQALQIFLKNQRQWETPALSEDAIARFKDLLKNTGMIPTAAHDSYLINLAAEDPLTAEKSVAAFAEELRRSESLGIRYLITHPGAHLGHGIEAGLERVVSNLDRAISLAEASTVNVLIETTAGQGTHLGSSFEEIAFILSLSKYGGSLGVCLDTCHVFAAGYDFRTEAAFNKTFSSFDRIIGLQRLRFFHLNDSKKGLGSRVDRHEHIGKGMIGLEGFRLLLTEPRFQKHPMVLETPKGKDLAEDKRNLRLLRSLVRTPSQPLGEVKVS